MAIVLFGSNYITNRDGNISQHDLSRSFCGMEYLPFGETLAEEHLNSNNSPYKFNGKELDQETGNYYYGARYYDPKFSMWLSVDPMAEKYPGWSPYNYALQNPVRLVDPTGMGPVDWRNKNGDLVYDAEKGIYTKYATAEDKKYGNMLRNSGKIGKGQFEYLVNSSTKTKIIFSDKVGHTEEYGGLAFGKTHDIVRGKKGKIKSATITVYKGTLQKAMDRFNGVEDGRSLLLSNEKKYIEQGNIGVDALITETFGHEIAHTTKKNQDWNEMKDNRAETYPLDIGEAILKELSNKGKK